MPAQDYIVCEIADAELLRSALGILYAQRAEIPYPMPGPTWYVWDPMPSASGTQAAFGPLDSLGGPDTDFGEWCLGREVETGLGTLTVPADSESLSETWFPSAIPPG